MKKQKKIILWVLGVLIIVVLVGITYFLILPYYKSWRIGYQYEQFEKAYLDYLKQDRYGGKTPQETYEMYIKALKKQDIELASRYFWWKQQVPQKKRLEELKEKGELEKYIEELPEWEEMREENYWTEGGKRFSYEYILKEDKKFYDELLKEWDVWPAGKYQSWIDFHFNKHSKVWKIYSL